MYGNQDEIGNALAKLMKEGVVKRKDIWITSKACAPCQHLSQAAYGRLEHTRMPWERSGPDAAVIFGQCSPTPQDADGSGVCSGSPDLLTGTRSCTTRAMRACGRPARRR